MYLSRLKMDPRYRETRRLRLNPYQLHQAVSRAFPDESDGGPGRVLYRLDTGRNGQMCLLVQSEKKPDWTNAELIGSCLEEPVATKEYVPSFTRGQKFYFRLRANPVAKKATPDKPEVTRRLGLIHEDEQLKWLQRKATQNGFRLVNCTVIDEGKIEGKKVKDSPKLTHYAVRFEGVLVVVDPELFLTSLQGGIGPAKGFGFGLLSVAPVKE